MLRFVLTAVALVTLASTVQAQDEYLFADVGWNASPDSVTSAYTKLGLTAVADTTLGDRVFKGVLFDHPAVVVAQFADSGLAYVRIALGVEDGYERTVYGRLLSVLTEKYGEPPELYKGWFRAGMNEGGVYRSTWPIRRKGQPKPNSDNIEMFERLDLLSIRDKGVHIDYVGPAWPVEHQRRLKAKASPF